MINGYNSESFKKAMQIMLIVKTEIGYKAREHKILVVGSGEDSDILVSLLSGCGYDVYSMKTKMENIFDSVILLDYLDEETIVKLINKGAYIIDASKHNSNDEDYYDSSHYRKIRIISLAE